MGKIIQLFRSKATPPMEEEFRFWIRRRLLDGQANSVILLLANYQILELIDHIAEEAVRTHGDGRDVPEFVRWLGIPDYLEDK
jgi:hypothetical protein